MAIQPMSYSSLSPTLVLQKSCNWKTLIFSKTSTKSKYYEVLFANYQSSHGRNSNCCEKQAHTPTTKKHFETPIMPASSMYMSKVNLVVPKAIDFRREERHPTTGQFQ
jgi:hypothetical protein